MNNLAEGGGGEWLLDLKQRIPSAQQRAFLSVNCKLVLLYWPIGRDILGRQKVQGFGAKVIDQLAHHLTAAFPGMRGFLRRDLQYKRSFAEQWPELEFVQQAVAQIPWSHKRSDDQAMIGRLLCYEKNTIEVKFGLRDIKKPMSVSEYTLVKALPDNLKGAIPTVQEIESDLLQMQHQKGNAV